MYVCSLHRQVGRTLTLQHLLDAPCNKMAKKRLLRAHPCPCVCGAVVSVSVHSLHDVILDPPSAASALIIVQKVFVRFYQLGFTIMLRQLTPLKTILCTPSSAG